MAYWQDRIAKTTKELSEKNTKKVEKQLAKYYSRAMKNVITEFENTYNKLLATIAKDKEPTPADLYKLDKYWKLQAQMRYELRRLGEQQIAALSDIFEVNFFDVYYSYAVEGQAAYSTIDAAGARQLINSIWCADGKSWSQRIWHNTEQLLETLNEELVDCVVSGKKTTHLKKVLQERFNVSYARADALARTELAHIQTQAAEQRYKDYGIKQVEIWADEDERRCDVCGKLHQTKYFIGEHIPIPAHTRCRCCIVPVVEDDKKDIKEVEKIKNKFGKEIQFSNSFNKPEWEEAIDIIKKLSNEYDTRLSSVKLGSLKTAGSVDMGGTMYLSSKKPETAIHEFAHSLSQKNLTKLGLEEQADLWKEIERIRRAYKKDAGDNPLKWISSYEHSGSIDEFFAEAFTSAKAKEFNIDLPNSYGKDNEYSKEVLKVIDKYFKKKKRK